MRHQKTLGSVQRRWVAYGRRAVSFAYMRAVGLDYRVFSYLTKLKVESSGPGLFANHRTRLSMHTRLGSDCSFNGLVVVGEGPVSIGDGFRSGPDCMIITSTHNYHGDALPYGEENTLRQVTIGDYVWIGARVVILPGATLGDGCIVQTGSVVTGSVPPLSIVGGHPARPFGERDEAHWQRMLSGRGSARTSGPRVADP